MNEQLPEVIDKEVIFTTVKKDNLIHTYYRGNHVGAVLEGDETSVIELMDKVANMVLERAEDLFKKELFKQLPDIANNIQQLSSKNIINNKATWFEKLFGF